MGGAYIARCPHCRVIRAATWTGLADADRDARRWRREGYDVSHVGKGEMVYVGPHTPDCPEREAEVAQAAMQLDEAAT